AAFSLSFFLYCYVPLLSLHSVPTRRSSDLLGPHWVKNYDLCCKIKVKICSSLYWIRFLIKVLIVSQSNHKESKSHFSNFFAILRSEEHTSELQSRFDLVCRLLLEKKNEHYN